ncbi:MAG: PilZ domain-containing protein [Candidatus Omnitrophica bacterium]|nr:PilZ domain-containing protein [Candidatus Omnitrophota bacterium]
MERRRFPRVRFPCKITIYLPEEFTIITHTENVGCGGVRVLVEKRLKVSSIVGLELFVGETKPVRCKGKVVWEIEKKNPLNNQVTLFDIGLEFIDIKDVDREHIRELIDKVNE